MSTTPRLACIHCRNVKTRCIPHDPGKPSSTCTRCMRLSLDCSYHPKRKRALPSSRNSDARDRESRANSNDDTAFPPNNPSTQPTASHASQTAIQSEPATASSFYALYSDGTSMTANGNPDRSLMTPYQPAQHPMISSTSLLLERPSNFPSMPPQETILTPTPRSTLSREHGSVPDPQSALPGRGSLRPLALDVSLHLDPGLGQQGGTDGVPGEVSPPVGGDVASGTTSGIFAPQSQDQQSSLHDPVVLELISSVEANKLFQLYIEKLNPMISILDPELSTPSYTRARSSILYTAILAVSAKFFAPSLHPTLNSHAQSLLHRAVSAGACDVHLIQALLIVVYWKAPTDTTGWMKVGMAVRLGYQLCLHLPRKRALPKDATEARVVRNAERTWYCVSCFDRMYSELFNLPFTIRLSELGSVDAWSNEGPRGKRSRPDLHVASACSTAASQIAWGKYRHMSTRLSREWRWTFLLGIADDYERHLHYWCPDDVDARLFPDAEHRFLRWFDLCHLLRLKQELSECAPDEPTASSLVTECLALADEFTSQTRLLADDQSLLYLQDTSAAHLSFFAGVMFKLFWNITPKQKRLVLHYLQQVYICCIKVAAGDPGAVTAFIARYLQRLLGAISAESRANSRAPSPAATRPNSTQPAGRILLPNKSTLPQRSTGSAPALSYFQTVPFEPLNGVSLSDSDLQDSPRMDLVTELDHFLSMTAADNIAADPVVDNQYWASILGADMSQQLLTLQ